MSDIRPFRGYRPPPELVAHVACPPYDVVSSEEARAIASGNPHCFLRVSRPEVDLPLSVDPHSPEVYHAGARTLARFIGEGTLRRDPTPSLYVYQQSVGRHVQAGVVAAASVDEYQRDTIRKHELTREDKEMDRAAHTDILNANTGPVFLTYRAVAAIDDVVRRVRSRPAAFQFLAEDGVEHTLWPVISREEIEALRGLFARVPVLYVADGHHRSAAASRVRDLRRAANPHHTGEEPYNFFLAVLFPHNQLRILDYNRVVKDLGGLGEDEFTRRVSESFEISPAVEPRPRAKAEFGMYLGGAWHRLKARAGTYPENDPVRRLDVSILQDNLLAPVLGIADPRKDTRIDFVGGVRGLQELERRCAKDAVLAFALFPTGIDELLAIADAGEIMPPKSTWFEPKLRSGVVVRLLED